MKRSLPFIAGKKIIFLVALICLCSLTRAQITWSSGSNIASSSYSNYHPRIVTDVSGNPLVVWGRTSDESVFFSRWNSGAFTTPVKLNPSWLTVATQSWMGPDIAVHGDTVYVVMKQTPEGDTSSHIYIVHSFDAGATFSSPVQVDHIADSISRFPTVTTDADGNPVVGFMKFNSFFLEARWVVARSSDFGETFSADVEASGWSGSDALVCDCCPGGMASDGNIVCMLYRNNQNDIRDSWVGLSTDGGATFTEGWNVDQNNWNLFACPATGPDGVIIGDNLYSVFMNGTNGDSRVYWSTSSISNGTAQPSELLTGSIMGLDLQNYPRIDKSGNAVGIVWKQTVGGQDQLPILFTNDISNGFPSTYDTVDLSNITNADIALSNGNVFVVWEDDNSGTVKYRIGTYSVSTGIDGVANSNLSLFPNPAQDQFIIEFNQSKAAHVTVQLISISGQIITTLVDEELNAGHSQKTFNAKSFPSGCYFVKTSVDGIASFSKLIIL